MLEAESDSAAAERGLDNLIKKLENLRAITSNARGYGTTAKGIREIKDAANGISDSSARNLRLVVDALQGLKNISSVKISSSIAAQLKNIGDAAQSISGVDFSKVATLGDMLAPLAKIEKSAGLASTVAAMGKLPKAIEGVNKNLDDATIARFTERVNALRQVILPLADEMRAVSAGFGVLPRNIQKAINMTNKFASASENTHRRTNGLLKNLTRIGAAYISIRSVWQFGADAFTESNNFVESINLANVAMGEGAREAMAFAKRVEDLIGINMSDWIAQVGTFNQMLAGFGISQKQSAKMSQQLTQLGYDIQSAFNVSSLDQVMDRLQSGLAGQIKGMREYGVELSVAAMKEFALERGITKSWTAMNIAEKTALRYAKIMADTSNIQQDLSRTLITPSNALRVLSAQWEVATRYIGQFVSVIATRVIPVLQKLVAVISALAQSLASAWGYVLPDIPTTGIVGGLDDVEDAIDDVGGAAGGAGEELKGMLASWDEINVIQSESGGGGGGGGSSVMDDMFDFTDLTDYSYDFLDGIKSKTQEITSAVQKMIPWLQTAATALGTWVVTDKIMDFLELVGLFKDVAGNGLAWKIPLTITGIVTGFMLESIAAKTIFENNGITLESLAAAALGFAVTAGAVGLASGSAGIALTVAGGVTLLAFLNEFRIKKQKEYAELANEAFSESGEDGVSVEDMIAAVEAEFSERAGSAKLVIDAYAEVGNYNEALQEATAQIKALNDVIFGDEALTSEQATTFKTAWETVTTTLDSITTADYSTVFQGLVQAAQSANEQLAEEALEAQVNFNQIQKGYTALQAEHEAEMNSLVDLIAAGEATEKDKERYAELSKYFSVSKEDLQTQMQFKDAIENAANVNYENIDDVNQYVSEMTSMYEKYVDINNKSLDAFVSGVEDVKVQAFREYQIGEISESQYQSTIDEMDEWIDIYKRDVEIRNEELRKQTATLFEGIFEQAITAPKGKGFTSKESDAYLKNILFPLYKVLSESDIVDDEVLEHYDKLMNDIGLKIKSWDEIAIGSDLSIADWFDNLVAGAEKAKGIANERLESLRDMLMPIDQADVTITVNDTAVTEATNKATVLKEVLTEIQSVAVAKQAEEALSNLGWLQVGNAKTNFLMSYYTQEEVQKTFDQTFALIEAAKPEAVIEIEIDNSNVPSEMDETKQLVMDALKEISYDIPVNINVELKINSTGLPVLTLAPTIPQYADGGIPATGSLFIANESGPELVGQFGGGTGVANSDQIVAGIASGVAQANSSQNAILREQNDLLRRLLEKEFTAEINPSVGFGQAAKRSIDMFSKVSGVNW